MAHNIEENYSTSQTLYFIPHKIEGLEIGSRWQIQYELPIKISIFPTFFMCDDLMTNPYPLILRRIVQILMPLSSSPLQNQGP
jgi:hypothetical protein